jgi:xylulokinase
LHNEYVNGHGAAAAVLGIELGTSAVKALVAGPDGRVLGRGVAGYRVRVPASGRAETAPEDWWLATRSAVREALAEAGRVSVTALAVAGQMHGVVLADDRGAPLRSAILWLDQRAAAEAATYAELPWDYTAVLGNRPSPGMAGPLLCWLATHEPHTLRASWWVLQPKDWLRLRLTGRAATDPTDASGTLLFDLELGCWADPLIEKLGLPRDKLPPVRQPAEIAGRLLASPAAELGLPPGVPVAVGAANTAAALFAVDLRADEALLNLGSGGRWAATVPSLPSARGGPVPRPETETPPSATSRYRAVGGGCYRLAPVPNAGITLDWVRNLLGATWDELYDTASRPRRPDAPHFDPRLTPERGNPGAAGSWTGFTLAHEREDLMRSALDGLAGLLRQRLDDLRAAGHAPRRVLLGGGGTAHPAWRALLEETLGLPLAQTPGTWLAPAGAARLAARAVDLPAAC